ncbi:response regulator [Rhizobium leguminosarum]|nr:response regulator [Rhizobium leguminosarum]RWY63298.1 response regulator [Rhizobium leguminosarum]
MRQEDLDVLITDHGLPGMSGADLAVACRRRQPELGIVFSSGMIGIPQIDGHQLISDAVLLGKPYDEAGLAMALAQFRKM